MQLRNKLLSLFSGMLLLGLATHAHAQHFDVNVSVSAGKIVTGGYDDTTSTALPDVRVFGYDFGEVVGDPYVAGDPGFRGLTGSGLTAGDSLRFNIPSATSAGLPRNLSYWNGSGAVSWNAVPSGESLTLNFGSSNVNIGATETAAETGFTIQAIGTGGTVHRHLNAFLNGSDGNSIAGDGSEAAPGIYVFPLSLNVQSGTLTESDTLYIVFNNGLTETQHDAAIGAIEANIVPEPGTVGVVAFSLIGLLARRRRIAH